MQVNVIHGSSPDLFNMMVFPESTPATKQWVYEQFHRDTSLLTDMGRQFMTQAEELYKKLNNPDLTKTARRLIRGMKGIAHPNSIVRLDTVEAIQGAKPVMQRYIMAMPEIRKLYHRQLCDGYSDSYVDHEPGLVGHDHYDYRRVMNGIVVDTVDKDGNPSWSAFMYPDELELNDRELDAEEQFLICDLWDLARVAMLNKRDPTDIFNGELDL